MANVDSQLVKELAVLEAGRYSQWTINAPQSLDAGLDGPPGDLTDGTSLLKSVNGGSINCKCRVQLRRDPRVRTTVIEITNLVVSSTWTVTVDAVPANFAAWPADTALDIMNGLKAAIDVLYLTMRVAAEVKDIVGGPYLILTGIDPTTSDPAIIGRDYTISTGATGGSVLANYPEATTADVRIWLLEPNGTTEGTYDSTAEVTYELTQYPWSVAEDETFTITSNWAYNFKSAQYEKAYIEIVSTDGYNLLTAIGPSILEGVI